MAMARLMALTIIIRANGMAMDRLMVVIVMTNGQGQTNGCGNKE